MACYLDSRFVLYLLTFKQKRQKYLYRQLANSSISSEIQIRDMSCKNPQGSRKRNVNALQNQNK